LDYLMALTLGLMMAYPMLIEFFDGDFDGSFVAVVVGGLGSFGGTFLACLLIGQVEVFGILLLPRLAESFIFIFMLVILIVRPWGLSNKAPKI